MVTTVKRAKVWKDKLTPGKAYPLDEALSLVKEYATAKFPESIDAAVNLGIDASKSDQQVRGSTVMPHGIGKTVRVAVFTSGKNQDAARAAGADIVGLEDLAEKVKAGEINFDVVVASPDAMRVVGQLGPDPGPPRPDAQSEGWHRDRGCGGCRAQREGGSGALPRRQGRCGALRDRARQLRGRRAARQPAGAAVGSAAGQAPPRPRVFI